MRGAERGQAETVTFFDASQGIASVPSGVTTDTEDAFNDPIALDASGYYGSTFSYDTSTNILGSTAALTGYQQYKIGLFVDFALMDLTVAGAAVPEPSTSVLLVCAEAVLFVGALRSRKCFGGY